MEFLLIVVGCIGVAWSTRALLNGRNPIADAWWVADMSQLRILQKGDQEWFIIETLSHPRVSLWGFVKPRWREVDNYGQRLHTISEARYWITTCLANAARDAAPWVEVK